MCSLDICPDRCVLTLDCIQGCMDNHNSFLQNLGGLGFSHLTNTWTASSTPLQPLFLLPLPIPPNMGWIIRGRIVQGTLLDATNCKISDDKVMAEPLPPPQSADGGGKRKRTESGSSSGSHRSAASSSRHSGADFLPTFTRGGSRGGGRGGGRGRFPANFNKMSNSSGYDSRYAKSDPRRSGGDRSGNSSSGGGYGSRYNSGSGGGGGSYSRN